ncbi:hypothetical protein RvY_01529 [Ramazzottius varieornatus]|uniref:RRM domain-containing protein n=1 Tax=Ramazzottius varieornatus TaxID=947166 RepID=A0A1D1UKH7_RAMVA|nr:hypothetical protein RvY_01529 [Ramazzottius varieornatus]
MEISTVNGNAVVFFHTSVVTPPATNVKVVPLTDLLPRGDSRISEKTVCDAKIRRGSFPCLVLEINTGKTLDQLRKKAADNEEDYEEAALRWLKELGVQVPGSDVLAGIPHTTTSNKSSAQNVQTPPVPSVKPVPPANHIVPPVLVVQSEPRNRSQEAVSTPVASIPTNSPGAFPKNLELKTAAVENGGTDETDPRQAYSPTDEEKISTVSEPITPPSAPRQEHKGEENRHDGDTRRRLYIGNLPRDTTETEIRALFGNFGVIMDIQIMVDQKSDRYFAFLTYETEGMVDVAQKNRPHILHNQELKTRRVVPRQQAFEDGTLSDAIQIFVRGVQDQMTEQDVGEYFSCYGEVARVDIPHEKTTGRRLNYAFVTFKDHDVVDKIVLTGEHYLKSARLLVKKVSPSNRPALRKPQFSQSPSVLSPSRGSTSSFSSADVVVEGDYTSYNGWGSQPVSSPHTPYGQPPQQYQSPLYQAVPARPRYAPRGRGGTSAAPSPMRPAYAGGRARLLTHTSPYLVRGGYSSSPRGRGSANRFRR